VAADGARPDKAGEEERCLEVRDIATAVDWNCEVRTLFRDRNLGCREAVTNAIDWFFENVDEGIILEDDCLPNQSFFWFCQELLAKYKYDESIMHIGGTNPIDKGQSSDTYYFTKYNRIWGWATWRRAWKYFDPEIKLWEELRQAGIHYHLFVKNEAMIWERIWNGVLDNEVDTWDYQWFFCRLIRGKAVMPGVNLVSNIGFDQYATHTQNPLSPLSRLRRGTMTFPIVHPSHKIEDFGRDEVWSTFIQENSCTLRGGLKGWISRRMPWLRAL
jgi:hypothetical protein